MGERAGISTEAGIVVGPSSEDAETVTNVGGRCAVRYDKDSRRVVSEW